MAASIPFVVCNTKDWSIQNRNCYDQTQLCLLSVYLTSLHVTRSPRPPPSVLPYCQRLEVGTAWELGYRGSIPSTSKLQTSLLPLYKPRRWRKCRVVLNSPPPPAVHVLVRQYNCFSTSVVGQHHSHLGTSRVQDSSALCRHFHLPLPVYLKHLVHTY